MIFTSTKLKDAFLIDLDKREDDRGFFARAFCQKEFETHGIDPRIAQANVSHNFKKGTMRGLHYQIPPHGEAKTIRCIRGAIYDVIVDLRPDSPTFKQWIGAELSQENRRMLHVPQYFGHAYLTLADDTEVLYLVSEFYHPDSERGLRYNDPAFGIEWPAEIAVISEKDKNWKDFE